MTDIQSKYNGEIVSKDETLAAISSKTESKITSTARSSLSSSVMNTQGASDIVAMAGAFSKCRVGDWKQAKEMSLKSGR